MVWLYDEPKLPGGVILFFVLPDRTVLKLEDGFFQVLK